MENVEEKFEPFRADAFDEFHAPSRVVALVILVRAFAVEQFHAECDFVFLRKRGEPFQTRLAILKTFLVVELVAISGKANDALESVVR